SRDWSSDVCSSDLPTVIDCHIPNYPNAPCAWVDCNRAHVIPGRKGSLGGIMIRHLLEGGIKPLRKASALICRIDDGLKRQLTVGPDYPKPAIAKLDVADIALELMGCDLPALLRQKPCGLGHCKTRRYHRA